jgi:hypothetical protein
MPIIAPASKDPIPALNELTAETTLREIDSIEVFREIKDSLREIVLHLRTITNEDFTDEN